MKKICFFAVAAAISSLATINVWANEGTILREASELPTLLCESELKIVTTDYDPQGSFSTSGRLRSLPGPDDLEYRDSGSGDAIYSFEHDAYYTGDF